LKLARGEIFAWLDDDDRWIPEKVERVVDFLERNPDRKWVHSDAIEVDTLGNVIHESYLHQFEAYGLTMEGHVFDEILITCFPLSSTVAMRRECLKRLGGFFTSESYGVDLDLYTRASIYFPIGMIADPLVYRTMHPPDDSRTNSVYDSIVRCGCRIPVFRRLLDGGYPLTPHQRKHTNKMLKAYHFKTAEAYLAAGQASEAMKHYRRCILRPAHSLRASFGALRCLVESCLPHAGGSESQRTQVGGGTGRRRTTQRKEQLGRG
jgi:hypothetical protein